MEIVKVLPHSHQASVSHQSWLPRCAEEAIYVLLRVTQFCVNANARKTHVAPPAVMEVAFVATT
jgi:hypothetical protein